MERKEEEKNHRSLTFTLVPCVTSEVTWLGDSTARGDRGGGTGQGGTGQGGTGQGGREGGRQGGREGRMERKVQKWLNRIFQSTNAPILSKGHFNATNTTTTVSNTTKTLPKHYFSLPIQPLFREPNFSIPSILPKHYLDTTYTYYLNTTSVLLINCQDTTWMLLQYYPNTTKILPKYYPNTTKILPKYYPNTTQILLTHIT